MKNKLNTKESRLIITSYFWGDRDIAHSRTINLIHASRIAYTALLSSNFFARKGKYKKAFLKGGIRIRVLVMRRSRLNHSSHHRIGDSFSFLRWAIPSLYFCLYYITIGTEMFNKVDGNPTADFGSWKRPFYHLSQKYGDENGQVLCQKSLSTTPET